VEFVDFKDVNTSRHFMSEFLRYNDILSNL
jgi:hypothetical protein